MDGPTSPPEKVRGVAANKLAVAIPCLCVMNAIKPVKTDDWKNRPLVLLPEGPHVIDIASGLNAD